MIWSNFVWRIIIFSVAGLGIGGNFFLFAKHVYASVMGLKKKPMDFIIIQLTLSNAITLWASGILDIRLPFHFNDYSGSVVCKIVVYLGRVARGLSICTSCLFSMVQAITISPRTVLWGKLKPQSPWQVLTSLLLFWIINFLISSNLLHYVTSVSSMNRSAVGMYLRHCYMIRSKQIIRWLFLSLMALRDVIFQSLMGWSSGHMAFCLYEHRKRVLYLHSSRLAKNSSPEIRATIRILILMICFLFFYWADFIFSFYIGSVLAPDSMILNIKVFLGLGYASLSPFVLISRDVSKVKYCHSH
ncbi:putative vomeronasal receptor-like protein 4 [Fukomys damarensis]|uniref:putative vomeronasal receptor-like protein 4 n=1 Tax=Fukomys damarensis TaxID=885580 RepID=UPI00053FA856|nr:putative vomeronasal receptor-like protein 4 [Fukomys damarensis]